MDAESKRLAYQPIAHSVLHWGQMDLPKLSPFGDFTLLIFICLIFMILLFRMANDEYEILSYTLILNCVDYYSAYYLMPWNFLLPNVLVSLFWPNFFWNHQSSIYLSFFIPLMVFLYSFWFFNQRDGPLIESSQLILAQPWQFGCFHLFSIAFIGGKKYIVSSLLI